IGGRIGAGRRAVPPAAPPLHASVAGFGADTRARAGHSGHRTGAGLSRPHQSAARLPFPSTLQACHAPVPAAAPQPGAPGPLAGGMPSLFTAYPRKRPAMSRTQALANAEQCFDSGAFRALLARRLAIPTESQNPERADVLASYLEAEMRPAFEAMGFACATLTHPQARAPFLYAERIEDPALPTVFGYGHGDVIRGLDREWHDGLSPWELAERDGRWYGRGIADNKGQHSINMEALRLVLQARGKLGFNVKYLIEMGEETGSMGLRELCAQHKERFAADLLIASDGPRLSAARP